MQYKKLALIPVLTALAAGAPSPSPSDPSTPTTSTADTPTTSSAGRCEYHPEKDSTTVNRFVVMSNDADLLSKITPVAIEAAALTPHAHHGGGSSSGGGSGSEEEEEAKPTETPTPGDSSTQTTTTRREAQDQSTKPEEFQYFWNGTVATDKISDLSTAISIPCKLHQPHAAHGDGATAASGTDPVDNGDGTTGSTPSGTADAPETATSDASTETSATAAA